MLKILTGAAIIAAAVLAPLPAAAASTPAHITCTATFDGLADPGSNNFFVDWDANSCGHYLRIKLFCNSRFMGSYNAYGGFVRATEPTVSAQHCKSGFVGQVVWAQTKNTADGSLTTCEEWPTQTCTAPR